MEAYQQKFDELYKLHKASSDRGEMLTVSIAKDKVNNIVWAAKPGGYKYSDKNVLDVVSECRDKIKDYTGDYVQTYTDVWKGDCPIFCAGALSIPGEGEDVCKIRSIHLTDQEKYQKYKQEQQKLFELLKRRNN